MAREISIGPASAIPVGEGRRISAATAGTRRDVGVFHAEDGAFYAVDDLCTHQDYPLTQGFVDGTAVECPLHGASFCLRTGKALSLPATEPVATHRVEERDGQLVLVVDDAAASGGDAEG